MLVLQRLVIQILEDVLLFLLFVLQMPPLENVTTQPVLMEFVLITLSPVLPQLEFVKFVTMFLVILVVATLPLETVLSKRSLVLESAVLVVLLTKFVPLTFVVVLQLVTQLQLQLILQQYHLVPHL